MAAEKIENDKNIILSRIDGLSSISVEISASSEEMSASIEEVASASQILNKITNEMIDEVNKFKV